MELLVTFVHLPNFVVLSFLSCLMLFFSDDRGMLELRRTTDYGKTIKTVASKIFSFGLGGRFLFASIMTGKVSIQLVQITSRYRNMIRHPEAKY